MLGVCVYVAIPLDKSIRNSMTLENSCHEVSLNLFFTCDNFIMHPQERAYNVFSGQGSTSHKLGFGASAGCCLLGW